MSAKKIDRDLLKEKAQALVASLDSSSTSDSELEAQIEVINNLRDDSLFRELGKMTREIHESIMKLRMDSRFSNLAKVDIPDAKDRLEYVIGMTEKAANTVLNVIEQNSPEVENLGMQATGLQLQWEKFRQRALSQDEMRSMGHELETFLNLSEEMFTELLSGFTDIMMAQDFQDLTGQIIRQVIELVNEIESNLVELVKIQGEGRARESAGSKPGKKKSASKKGARKTSAEGPQIPGKDASGEVVNGQDDVDDLLASLGF